MTQEGVGQILGERGRREALMQMEKELQDKINAAIQARKDKLASDEAKRIAIEEEAQRERKFKLQLEEKKAELKKIDPESLEGKKLQAEINKLERETEPGGITPYQERSLNLRQKEFDYQKEKDEKTREIKQRDYYQELNDFILDPANESVVTNDVANANIDYENPNIYFYDTKGRNRYRAFSVPDGMQIYGKPADKEAIMNLAREAVISGEYESQDLFFEDLFSRFYERR